MKINSTLFKVHLKEIRFQPFIFYCVVFCMMLPGCDSKQGIKSSKLEGEWVAADGSILIIHQDSIFHSSFDGFKKIQLNNDALTFIDEEDTIKIVPVFMDHDKINLTYYSSDDTFNEKYTRLSSSANTQLNSFDSISFYSGGCYGTCPVFAIDIACSGEFQYHGIMYMKDSTLFSGVLPFPFLLQLDKFVQACDVDSSIRHFHPNYSISDQLSRAMSILHKNGKKFATTQYSVSGPPSYKNLYQYLSNLVALIDLGYVIKHPLKGTHYFESILTDCHNLEDSISYMSNFDSVNYRLPQYSELGKDINQIVNSCINKDLVNNVEDDHFYFVEYQIDTNGNIKVSDAGMKFKQDLSSEINHLVEQDINHCFAQLKSFKAAIYAGRKVEMNSYMHVYYGRD